MYFSQFTWIKDSVELLYIRVDKLSKISSAPKDKKME